MKELHREGLAIHPGPESCASDRKVRGEALTGEHAGQVLSPDIRIIGLSTLCSETEGNIGWCVIASANRNPRGPRPCACVEASCARTGRSHGHSLDRPASRMGKAKAVTP